MRYRDCQRRVLKVDDASDNRLIIDRKYLRCKFRRMRSKRCNARRKSDLDVSVILLAATFASVYMRLCNDQESSFGMRDRVVTQQEDSRTEQKRRVRQAIPKSLPYFAVNFGNHGGFAHVIEDEKLFPKTFAQEIIGGMMDLDHRLWRKPRREIFEQQRKNVLEFPASWKPYDFTTKNGTYS